MSTSNPERQVARFTGLDTVITFDGLIVSTEYTKFNFEGSIRLEEKTAGNERDASFNPTVREGKWDLTVYDIGETGIIAGITSKFFEGTVIGVLAVYKKGRVNGRPEFSFPALVQTVKHPVEATKNVEIEISGVKNGEYIVRPDGLVSGV